MRASWHDLGYAAAMQKLNSLPKLRPTLSEAVLQVPQTFAAIGRIVAGSKTTRARLLQLAYQEERSRSCKSNQRKGRGRPPADWARRVGMSDPVDALMILELLPLPVRGWRLADLIELLVSHAISVDATAPVPIGGERLDSKKLKKQIENFHSGQLPTAMKWELNRRRALLSGDRNLAKDELLKIKTRVWPEDSLPE